MKNVFRIPLEHILLGCLQSFSRLPAIFRRHSLESTIFLYKLFRAIVIKHKRKLSINDYGHVLLVDLEIIKQQASVAEPSRQPVPGRPLLLPILVYPHIWSPRADISRLLWEGFH